VQQEKQVIDSSHVTSRARQQAVAECLSIPNNSPETAHDLAARHDRALLPKALTPQDVRPVRCYAPAPTPGSHPPNR